MPKSYLYFHLASSAQRIPLQGTQSQPDLSHHLSGPQRGAQLTQLRGEAFAGSG